MTDFLVLIRQYVAGKYTVSEDQLNLLHQHYKLLKKWNRKLNLTSVELVGDIVVRHYCEAIALASMLLVEKLVVADVGSGAGFPGIPVAILKPDFWVHLIESDSRKAIFLKEATFNVPNCTVHRLRFDQFTTKVDLLIGRAVHWRELKKHGTKVAPRFALLVGKDTVAEIHQGWTEIHWKEPVKLPWGDRRYILQGDRVPRET
jgi:16S rRNA (guanine527-N7)-methyltransferase